MDLVMSTVQAFHREHSLLLDEGSLRLYLAVGASLSRWIQVLRFIFNIPTL